MAYSILYTHWMAIMAPHRKQRSESRIILKSSKYNEIGLPKGLWMLVFVHLHACTHGMKLGMHKLSPE